MTDTHTVTGPAVAQAVHDMGASSFERALTADAIAAHRLCPIPRTSRFLTDHVNTVRRHLAEAVDAGLIERRRIDGRQRYWTPIWSKGLKP